MNKYREVNPSACEHFVNKVRFSPSCTKKHLCGRSRYGVVFKRVHHSSAVNSTGFRFIINGLHNTDAFLE